MVGDQYVTILIFMPNFDVNLFTRKIHIVYTNHVVRSFVVMTYAN